MGPSEAIRVLTRRRDFLVSRAGTTRGKAASYDAAEIEALGRAVRELQAAASRSRLRRSSRTSSSEAAEPRAVASPETSPAPTREPSSC